MLGEVIPTLGGSGSVRGTFQRGLSVSPVVVWGEEPNKPASVTHVDRGAHTPRVDGRSPWLATQAKSIQRVFPTVLAFIHFGKNTQFFFSKLGLAALTICWYNNKEQQGRERGA